MQLTTGGTLEIRPGQPRAQVDDPVGIIVSGCAPHAHVIIDAAVDWAGSVYASSGRYTADDQGRVDTATQSSHAGTYTGVDPFGLWWSGDPARPASVAPFPKPVRARVRVESGSRNAEANIERAWLAPGVTLTAVDDAGVQGLFARPAGDGPFAGVVAFGGSGGGLGPSGQWAALLASHGIATLAISYFGVAGVPAELVGIEVEVVERAVGWLRHRPQVQGRVGVMGASRGSELALLAGALLDGVAAVVALAPSGVAWMGLGQRGPVDAPTWLFRGQPLPFATIPRPSGRPDPLQPFALRPLFERALQDRAMIEAAEIPVERIPGPVLLVSGGADAMWPSTPMAEIATRRAGRYQVGQRFIHLSYPNAGHIGVGAPGTPLFTEAQHPVDGGFYAFGGTRAANARARADSWPRIVSFLTDALGPSLEADPLHVALSEVGHS